MLVVCSAVGRLAEQDAKRLKDLTNVCLDVCTDCEASAASTNRITSSARTARIPAPP